MSTETETGDGVLEGVSVLEPFRRYYHIPVLAILVAFMLWIRVLPAENFIRADGIYFSGNDAWYHLRETQYVVHNYPFTMPMDPMTQFPYGVSNSQFGTLYDQVVATTALVLGMGDPSPRLVAKTLLYAPAVFGALTAIPVYYVGKHLSGRLGGVTGVLVLALLPGQFLYRTTAGFSDHSAVAVFAHAIAVLAVVVALHVGETEKPIYELVLDNDWDALRKPTKYSALAGIGVSLYIWVWPPGIVLVGIIGVFYLFTLGAKYGFGESPDHIAYVGVVSMLTTALFSIVGLDELGFSASAISLVHILLTLGVALGAIFIAWLARKWEDLPFGPGLFPFTTLSIAMISIAVVAVVLPDAFNSIRGNLLRSVAIGQTDTTLTIGEAQARPAMGPQYLERLTDFLVTQYGLTFLTAIAGLGALVYRGVNQRARAEHMFVVLWTVFIFMMAITQSRFHTYLVVPVAVLNAVLVGELLRVVDIDSDFELSDVRTHHVSVLVAVFILVVAPLAPIGGIAMTSQSVHAQVTGNPDNANDNGPAPRGVTYWDSTTDWMQNGTPEVEGIDQYGTYEKVDDFEYPEGAYGVLSWWDYGHWITVRGERIPHANPFQAGARTASRYFLYENETSANLLLEALPSLSSRARGVDSYTNEDYREMIAGQTDQQSHEDIRYVTIDHQMATGKFGAIATWTGPPQRTYFNQSSTDVQLASGNRSIPYTQFSPRYEETMLSQLYWDNANGLEHYRLVHSSAQQKFLATFSQINPQNGQRVGARFMRSVGNVNENRTEVQMRLSFRSSPQLVLHELRKATSVKTFEYVEGANLTGSAPAGANVSVSLRLRNTQTGENFTYTQSVRANEDGEFVVTVPYATNDAVSPAEGGTDSLVVAQGEYTVNVEDGGITTVAVPESAVLEGDEITIEFGSGTESTTDDDDESDDSQSADDSTIGGYLTGPRALPAIASLA